MPVYFKTIKSTLWDLGKKKMPLFYMASYISIDDISPCAVGLSKDGISSVHLKYP